MTLVLDRREGYRDASECFDQSLCLLVNTSVEILTCIRDFPFCQVPQSYFVFIHHYSVVHVDAEFDFLVKIFSFLIV